MKQTGTSQKRKLKIKYKILENYLAVSQFQCHKLMLWQHEQTAQQLSHFDINIVKY